MDEPFVFIVNPAAGNEAAVRVWPKIENALNDLRATYEAIATYSAEEGEAQARQWAARPARAVIAVGGDGTMHSVANGLLQASQAGSGYLPLGIVPIGHHNYFARALGQAGREPVEAARRLLEGWPQPIDVGLFRSDLRPGEERFFAFRLGIGVDARLAGLAEQAHATRGGLRGSVGLWQTVRSQPPVNISLTTGGQLRLLSLALLTAGTALRHTERYFPTEGEPDEGVMELCVARAMSSYALTRLVSRARQGRPSRQVEVTVEEATRFSIESESPFPLQADGELLGKAFRVEVELLPGRLPVLQ